MAILNNLGCFNVKPYFTSGDAVIYHGDCRALMADLDYDSIVSDPPYGQRLDTDYGARWSYRFPARSHRPVIGDDRDFDPAHLLAKKIPTILWGAQHYAQQLPNSRGWLVWDKQKPTGWTQPSVELAWSTLTTPHIFRYYWHGMFRDPTSENIGAHPTQKPVALMRWCIGLLKQPACVLDPYCGSGSTLVAARLMGVKSVGIDVDEEYCEIAATRLRQAAFSWK